MGDELRVTVIATGISSIEENETISEIDVVSRPGASEPAASAAAPAAEESQTTNENRAVRPAKPNPVPKGLRPMPTPVFDEQSDLEELDEPAYLRRKAN